MAVVVAYFGVGTDKTHKNNTVRTAYITIQF